MYMNHFKKVSIPNEMKTRYNDILGKSQYSKKYYKDI